MNRKLRKLQREIERRGGVLHVAPQLPDEIAELFLREILECPDCMAEARKGAAIVEDPRGRGRGH
jgi:hypothetical protein